MDHCGETPRNRRPHGEEPLRAVFDEVGEELLKSSRLDNMKIAVAGTGYVGLSIATLLAQRHQVIAVDVVPESDEDGTGR